MIRSFIIHLVLVVGIAFFAWRVYQTPASSSESSSKEEHLVATTLESVAAITLRSDRDSPADPTVTIRPSTKLGWLVEVERHAQPQLEGAVDVGAPLATGDTSVSERFPASRALRRSVQSLFPLTPERRLGTMDEERLAAMGLSTASMSVSVTDKSGTTFSLRVGKEVFGGKSVYAQTESGEVVLMKARSLRTLNFDTKALSSKLLFQVKPSEASVLTVSKGKNTQRFLRQESAETKEKFWSAQASPDEEKDAVETFVNLLRRQRVVAFKDTARLPADCEANMGDFVLGLIDDRTRAGSLVDCGSEGFFIDLGPFNAEITAADGKALKAGFLDLFSAP